MSKTEREGEGRANGGAGEGSGSPRTAIAWAIAIGGGRGGGYDGGGGSDAMKRAAATLLATGPFYTIMIRSRFGIILVMNIISAFISLKVTTV